jgi:hypothetical protein
LCCHTPHTADAAAATHAPHTPPWARLRALADAQEDVDAKMRLRRLFRSLQGVDEELARYDGVLAKFLGAEQGEWEAIVAAVRGDLQKPFFEHMQVCDRAHTRGVRGCVGRGCGGVRAPAPHTASGQRVPFPRPQTIARRRACAPHLACAAVPRDCCQG